MEYDICPENKKQEKDKFKKTVNWKDWAQMGGSTKERSQRGPKKRT